MDEPQAELSRIARLRVEAVRGLARLLGVPIRISEHDMHEVKVNNIHRYIDECDEIAEKVFDLSPSQRAGFRDWARDHLFEMIDNPFNLHDHPLYFVAAYEGIFDHNDPRMKAIEEKFTEAQVKLRWPNGDG